MPEAAVINISEHQWRDREDISRRLQHFAHMAERHRSLAQQVSNVADALRRGSFISSQEAAVPLGSTFDFAGLRAEAERVKRWAQAVAPLYSPEQISALAQDRRRLAEGQRLLRVARDMPAAAYGDLSLDQIDQLYISDIMQIARRYIEAHECQRIEAKGRPARKTELLIKALLILGFEREHPAGLTLKDILRQCNHALQDAGMPQIKAQAPERLISRYYGKIDAREPHTLALVQRLSQEIS